VTLTGLAARNVMRNKFRVMLTIAGVAVAVLTFVTLRTVLDAWSNTDIAVKDRIVTRHKITFVMPLPKRYVHDVAEAKDGSGQKLMRLTTWANWFGGKDPKHEHEFFATIAIDPDT
jgi:putative ABC transport system permease protein